jgi:hypothetical protein
MAGYPPPDKGQAYPPPADYPPPSAAAPPGYPTAGEPACRGSLPRLDVDADMRVWRLRQR